MIDLLYHEPHFPLISFFISASSSLISMAKKSSCSSSSSQNPKQQHEKPSSSSKKQTSNNRKKIFTLNEELLILNCFFDFKSKTSQNTKTDYTSFYNSVKDLLSPNHTQDQLRKRIWKLKQKYMKMKKEENRKFPPRFYIDLEQEIIDISHKIWGQDNEENNENAAKNEELESVVVDKEEPTYTDIMDFSSLTKLLQEGMELIGESDRVELDGMCKELKVQESELALQRAQLIKDSTHVISKALQGLSSS